MTNVEPSFASETAVAGEDLLRAAMGALRAGDVIKAAEAADQARQQDQSARVLIVFAAISHALGRDVDALAILEQATALAPGIGNYPDAAAAILLKLGRKADGLFNLKLGTHLPSDPFLDAVIGDYFGNIKDIFDSFIENRPLTTARLMIEQGLYAGALRHLETYIGVSGGDAESFALTADSAIHLGAVKEAEVAVAALTALVPAHPKLADYALGVAVLKGDAAAVAAAVRTLSPVTDPGDALARYRLLALSPLVEAESLEAARAGIAAATAINPDVAPFDTAGWPQALTLGFVCATIDPALEATLLALKDRVPVKIYLLGTSSNPSLQRVRAGFEDVREAAAIDDATLIEMIRFDQVSVLFDCIGAAPFARPGLWKTRMAPVQALWALSDPYDDPASYEYRLAGEPGGAAEPRLLDLGVPLRYPLPPAELMGRVAEVRALKVERDAEGKGTRRLLAPHPGGLLPDATLDLYLSILEAVPEATLAFVAVSDLDDPLVSRLLAQADRRGCADRIDLIAPADFTQSRHEIILDADLVLDSLPYGNIDLVTECLWVTVPVLTLAGEARRERAAAALVRAVGVEELIATSPEDYRDKAVRLLTGRKALTDLKAHLAAQQKALTLAKYDAVATALVTKIESLWSDWYSKNA